MDLIKTFVKLKDSFTYIKEGRKTYRIRQVKKGITSYYTVEGIDVLRSKREDHKKNVRFEATLFSHSIVPAKLKKYKVDKVKKFYSTLKDCYYTIKGFSIYLFDEEDDRIYLMDDKGKDIEEKVFVRFYFTSREPVIEDREDISFWRYKKLKCDYYLLMVIPTLYFRDSKVVYNDNFYFGKEVTVGEALRIWKTVKCVYGYEETVVLINDIQKSKAERTDTFKRILKDRKEKAKKNKKELASILSLDVEILKCRTKPLPLVMRSHSDRTRINYAENKIDGKMDRQLGLERKELKMDRFFKEYNEKI